MLSVAALESLLMGAFGGRLVLTGDHAKGGLIPKAIAIGVVNELKGSAKVVVPAHAGGTYPVTELSESGMSQKVLQSLQGGGIKTENPFCKAGIIPLAVAKGVTSAVLASMVVSIPVDGSGEFKLTGLSAGAIESGIKSKLSEVLTLGGMYAKGGVIAEAAAPVIASYLNANAVVSGSFAPGGTYSVQ